MIVSLRILSVKIRKRTQLNVLRDGELTVTELSQKLGLTVGNLSQHLSMMKDRHVLLSRKEGNQVYYRIANPKLLRCFDMMREMLFEQIRKDAALIPETGSVEVEVK